MKKIIKKMSVDEIDVEEARQMANLKRLDPMRIFYNVKNFNVVHQGYKVPVRLYFPSRRNQKKAANVFIYIHGGGWTTDSIDTYDRICEKLARKMNHYVFSIDYRLAPEHKFPVGLMDCYRVVRTIYKYIGSDRITLIGDSAGGNLVAALSLLAKEKQEFIIQRQILIYPALNSDYSKNSPYASVHENGENYILTRGKLQDYIDLYRSKEEDLKNPLFAPILAEDLYHMPDTLLITAQFDPLKDEGKAFGNRLKEAGNFVKMYEIERAMHGFFALAISNFHVEECFIYIREFLNEREVHACPINENIGEN